MYTCIITASKRSLGQGNIFRSVCQEFCLQGGGRVPGQVPPKTRYPPEPGTPPWDQVHPRGTRYTPLGPGTPPRTRYTPYPGTRYIPQTRYTPSPRPGIPPKGWVHPPPRQTAPGPGTVHAGRYGQQAGGTYPTGMHSCYPIKFCRHVHS